MYSFVLHKVVIRTILGMGMGTEITADNQSIANAGDVKTWFE